MNRPSTPNEPFCLDRSGNEFLILDRTRGDHWSDLYELVSAINAAGHRAICRHMQVAADVEFAIVWNRLVCQYTSRRAPLSGSRMERLLSRVLDTLNASPTPEDGPSCGA